MEALPDNVISELQRIQRELDKAPEALYRAEIKLAELEAECDRIEALAFLDGEGTGQDRSARARLAVSPVRLQRDIAKAELNRVRTKIKVLESAAVSTSVIGKQVELMWKHG
jgi:hypothetical protein